MKNTYIIIALLIILCKNISPAFSQTNYNAFMQRDQEEKKKELDINNNIKNLTIKIFNYNESQYNVINDIYYYKLSNKWNELNIIDKDGNFLFPYIVLLNSNGHKTLIISESTYRHLTKSKDMRPAIEEYLKKGQMEKFLKDLIEYPDRLDKKQKIQLNNGFKYVDKQLLKKIQKEVGYKKFSFMIQKIISYLDDSNKKRLNNLLKIILEENKRDKINIEDKYRKNFN